MRTPLLLIAPLVLAAACSSGGTPSRSLESAPVPSATGSAGPSGVPSPTGGDPAPAGSRGPGPTTSTAAPTSASAAPRTTSVPGSPAGSKATRAGAYTYSASGKVTFGATSQDASGTQTLTISPPLGDRQRSTLHSDDTGDTVQELVVRDSGSYAASLTLTSPAFTKEFRPATPFLLLPDPATPGRSWTWTTTSTDGATHATASNQLLRKESLTIGGSRVDTVVLQTHLVLSGDISYDTQLTVWWAPAYRLPVKTHGVGKGSYSGVPFRTDITAVLRSVRPS